MADLKEFSLSEVTLKDDYLVNAFEKETDYLLSLDTDRLLAGFRETAGVDMRGAERYAGWENLLIGGHTLGHYLTAVAQAYECANADASVKEKLMAKIEPLINGLKECQDALGTGLIFGGKILDRDNIELQFDNVEKGLTEIFTQSWVPWYTMHKIFEGLISVVDLKAEISSTALKVMSRAADWTFGRTSSWSEETHKTVLSIEYGGMNDCLYKVYQRTGKKEHLEAAHAFDEVALFERILAAKPGDDALNNMHANTNIPKFMGALRRYEVVGDEKYLDYVKKFWELVTGLHTYITGGNSEWEHFGKDRILNAERTNCNCETCNVYNMLKITKDLFKITKDKKYADWYENAYINQILSSQNPETGMTTYFQAMATGYFKTYGERDTKFWCCVGSGMENFTKLGESFYMQSEDAVIVNQYFSSNLSNDRIELHQISHFPEEDTAEFRIGKDYIGKIGFRKPDWSAGDVKVEIIGAAATIVNETNASLRNGAVSNAEGINAEGRVADENDVSGYIYVKGSFPAGSIVRLTLPMNIVPCNLPDGENTYGFKYGPVVLSALLGSDDMKKTRTGVDVTIPENKLIPERFVKDGGDLITVEADSVEDFMKNINSNMERSIEDGQVVFDLKNTDSNLRYVTHYRQHSQRYGLYFDFKA